MNYKQLPGNCFPNVSGSALHQWNYKYIRTESVYATGIIFKGVRIDEQR